MKIKKEIGPLFFNVEKTRLFPLIFVEEVFPYVLFVLLPMSLISIIVGSVINTPFLLVIGSILFISLLIEIGIAKIIKSKKFLIKKRKVIFLLLKEPVYYSDFMEVRVFVKFLGHFWPSVRISTEVFADDKGIKFEKLLENCLGCIALIRRNVIKNKITKNKLKKVQEQKYKVSTILG